MRSYLKLPCKAYRLAFVLVLIPVCSAWTCSAFVSFDSCQTSVPQPQIVALSPNPIPADADSVQLIVDGTGFVRQSEILWNGGLLQTTFTDSRHLQTTVTQQTIDSLGGRTGGNALISVTSPGSTSIAGCPNGGTSGALTLEIN